MQILPPIPTSASAYVPTNISDIISSPGALKSSHRDCSKFVSVFVSCLLPNTFTTTIVEKINMKLKTLNMLSEESH
ncbi:hypothetical protein M8J76_012490 [Diaphorina citri]|nr:hypothetical protein M8J76_012490 [Diaphorina citri]